MDARTSVEILQRVPFAIASIVERCTAQGSCEREAAQRIYEALRRDIEVVLDRLKELDQKQVKQ